MYGVPLNMDSLDRADVFASAATYAYLRSGLRYGQSTFKRHHVDSLYRAVLGAGSAAGTVHVDYADVLVEYHTTRLGAMLLLNGERLDCSGRANLAAQVAVIVAVALIKLHHGLHYASYTVFQTGRLKHMAGAFAYAQMA